MMMMMTMMMMVLMLVLLLVLLLLVLLMMMMMMMMMLMMLLLMGCCCCLLLNVPNRQTHMHSASEKVERILKWSFERWGGSLVRLDQLLGLSNDVFDGKTKVGHEGWSFARGSE